MGAINYYTSDFITIGFNLNYIDYQDEEYLEDYSELITDYYEQIRYRLKHEQFYYFNVELTPGYYEGFTIDIEFNYKICFDRWNDRNEAQKEITRIKTFLLDCINNFECCAVFPGWVTTYNNHNESIKLLNQAIKEMREAVKQTPTYNNYFRNAS